MPLLLRSLWRLTAGEWRDLVRAQVALLTAEWRLRRAPLGRLATREADTGSATLGDHERAMALSTAVRRVARRGLFRPYCLVQSLALRSLLEREGIRGSSIRIGVRRGAGVFQAHAWVRWGQVILGDDETYVATFTEVDDLRVLDRR